MRGAGCLAICTVTAAAALHLPAPRAGRSAPISLLAGGGDLEQGRDPERNALLQSLRKSFFTSDDEEAPVGLRDAERLGLHLDLPLCRWGFNVLPHHRTALNVFQPQYTLMFNRLLSEPTTCTS